MKYYNMVGRGDTNRFNVSNLDAGAMYLMRVVSVNRYGTQPSEPINVTTKTDKPSPRKTPRISSQTPVIPIAVPVALMAAVLAVVGVVFWRWWRKKQRDERELKEKIEKLRKDPFNSSVDWFKLFRISVAKPWWEIPRDQLTIEHHVGGGAFGVVTKGIVKKIDDEGREHGYHCAVKMLKENPTERQLLEFCKEIKTVSSIDDHPNIVSLIGACTIDGPPLLVVKFAPNGCLLDYLKENRPDNEDNANEPHRHVITEKERLKFAYEIAQGMAHLEKHRFVHRDLAARNILLGKNMVAMVSDFGLSRDIYELGVYEHAEGGIIPFRWMPPESIRYLSYNSTTDVWSYGVLLWEMESGGNIPYGGLQGQEILEYLKQGQRLPKPRGTSRDIYSLMWRCWYPDPKQRPTFSDLVYQVGGLYALAGGNEIIVNTGSAFINRGMEQDDLKTRNNHIQLHPMVIETTP